MKLVVMLTPTRHGNLDMQQPCLQLQLGAWIQGRSTLRPFIWKELTSVESRAQWLVHAQVQSSQRLRQAAAAAITAGNAVNVGTPYGDARAVRLESLLKLADLKVLLP